ncbi:hypothetical protein C0585_01230 [Candidatus Woesearchaeota archaeon]|nr:MAG: hypothetical protein C0585_01230 [Candidatus Woesearchaeota archaeon]
MEMIYYFLPMILFLGIITSYEDIKFGKIRNKWIILALIYSFLINSILIFHNYFNNSFKVDYIMELSINLLFAIIIGFGFYYYDIWSAGDGKLFITFTSLIPLAMYSLGYQKHYPGISLLFNIFTISLTYILFNLALKFDKKNLKNLKEAFISSFTLKETFFALLFFFVIYWLIESIFTYLNFQNSMFYFILSLLIYLKLKDVNKIFFVMILLSFLRIAKDSSIYSLNFLKNFIIYGMLWRLSYSMIRGTFLKFFNELFYRELLVEEVKPGMILFEDIKRTEKKAKGQNAIKHGNFYYYCEEKNKTKSNLYIGASSDGLTFKDIKIIKKIGFKKMRVNTTIPFALLVFIGVIITILVKGNVLIYVKNLIL